MKLKTILTFSFICIQYIFLAQTSADHGMAIPDSLNTPEVRAENEKKFSKYMSGHGDAKGLADFKKNHPDTYYKELWYYSHSFHIKRNHVKEGVPMNETDVCIRRYEEYRKETEESIVILPGFKDALVLLPANKLIYKP